MQGAQIAPVAATATWGRSYGEQHDAPPLMQHPQVSHPQQFVDEGKLKVDSKAWPKFDGEGSLDTFLKKMEYFMRITEMPDRERASQIV